MKPLMVALSLLVVVVLSGCMNVPVAFVPASDPVDPRGYTILGESVSGTDTQVTFLFFTFGDSGSCQRHALDEALGQVEDADALVRMSVDREVCFCIPFLISRVRVTGTPVKVLRNL